jgi:DNA-binding IclR family transcriptional regulator
MLERHLNVFEQVESLKPRGTLTVTMNARSDPPDAVSTAVTTFEILECVKQRGGATVSEVAESVGLAVSTAHRHLATLVDHGFVHREDNVYRIGLRFLDFGVYSRQQLPYYEIARSQVETLAREVGEKIRLTAIQDDFCVLLYREMGDHPLMTSAQIGNRRHLHQLAAGKAMLAALPDDEVDRIVARRGLPGRTPNTITDEQALFEELETIRDRGYAFNRSESIEGLNAVGAAFRDEDGWPLGALSISGPANRLQGDLLEEELPSKLLGAVNEVEINLRYAPGDAAGN